MDLSDREFLYGLMKFLEDEVNVFLDQQLYIDFSRGIYPNMLDYAESRETEADVLVIQKYLLAINSYLHTPDLKIFYDVYNTGRIIPWFVALVRSLAKLKLNNVEGFEERLEKLLRQKNFDDFEAIVFEMIVAAKYIDPGTVRFLEESNKTVPDLEVNIAGKLYYVECKKANRENDLSLKIKRHLKGCFKSVFELIKDKKNPLNFELEIFCEVFEITEEDILEVFRGYLDSKTTKENSKFSLKIKSCKVPLLKDFALYPSPGYFKDHFGYHEKGKWHGIFSEVVSKNAGPSWIDELIWQTSVKWRFRNSNDLWVFKKFSYSPIKKGIKQASESGSNSILHFCVEKVPRLGHRRSIMIDLFERLKSESSQFSWLILNEVSAELTAEARFDFQETAHPISGVTRKPYDPNITTVFIDDEYTVSGGRFGIGSKLPDLDSLKGIWPPINKAKK